MDLKKTLHSSQFLFYLVCIFVFFLPSFQKVSVIAFAVILICFLINKKNFQNSSLPFKNPLFIGFSLFYLMHIAGVFYSDNLKYAFFDIQTKLSFLLMPFIFLSLAYPLYSFRNVQVAFISGNVFACLVCFVRAILRFISGHSTTFFFYVDYSTFIHVTYFTMFLNLALLFLMDYFFKNQRQLSGKMKWLVWILFIFLFLNAILLSGRTAFVVLLFTTLFYGMYNVYKSGKIKSFLFPSFSVILICITLVYLVGVSQTRFKELKTIGNEPAVSLVLPLDSSVTQKKVNYNNINARYELWKNALVVIRSNFLLGVGTGDIKEELIKQYQVADFKLGIEQRFSPHNQFLHTMVILGCIGLVFLLLLFYVSFRSAIAQRNLLYILFLLIIVLNGLTESNLEVQSGVLFFAFFSCFFFRQNEINTFDERILISQE